VKSVAGSPVAVGTDSVKSLLVSPPSGSAGFFPQLMENNNRNDNNVIRNVLKELLAKARNSHFAQ
ncbi:hypothetical protein, partial [Brachyspira catarrhinii]|uniref:hypothetical protein n=1 Tax=Brachyspira catarrhinii TaxID=2528966 RepID=UPI00138737BA